METQAEPLLPAVAADMGELFGFVEREEARKEAERRQRHRESMARGRSRQSASMAAMRREHAALVLRQQELMAAHRRRQLQLSPTPPSEFADTDSDGSDAQAAVMDRYQAAVETEDALLRERTQIAKRLEELEIFEAVLRVDTPPVALEIDLAAGQAAPAEPTQQQQQQEQRVPGRRGHLVHFTPEEPPFYFEPVSEQTCHAWIRDAYRTCRRHDARFKRRDGGGAAEPGAAFAATTAVAHCFGWRVQRSLVDSHLHFHFSKRFPTCDPEALATRLFDRGWDVLNDPAKYVKLYRTVFIVKVLQRVDPFNSIILRNSPSPDRSHHIRSVTVMSKVVDVDERGRRVLTIVNLVTDPRQDAAPPAQLQPSAPPRSKVRYIRDACTYITLTIGHGKEGDGGGDGDQDGDQDEGGRENGNEAAGPYVEMTYGGHGDCLNEMQAQYLFVETGHVLFRFEQVLCPRNLVTSC
jgi:hypothetical protein